MRRLAGVVCWVGFSSLVNMGCGDSGSGSGDDSTSGSEETGSSSEPEVCESNDDCDDGKFCNGEERCRPDSDEADEHGCIEARSSACGSNSCDEDEAECGCENPDTDDDGHDSIECGGDDCDDADANRFPGNPEVCDSDHHDEDCDATTYGIRDQDGDDDPDDQCCNEEPESGDFICGTDCNDSRGIQHSFNTEICDDIDNDCDGLVDESIDGNEDDGLKKVFTIDEDGDGRGSAASDADTVVACDPPDGYVDSSDDCDDDNNQVSPESTEVCDYIDNDCDGLEDEQGSQEHGLKKVYTVDEDNDLFGSDSPGAETVLACEKPNLFALATGDCNDEDSDINPGEIDSCTDLVDNDCSGEVNDPIGGCVCEGNETRSCALSGALGKCATFTQQCNDGVWDDCPLERNNEPEVCDSVGVDEDCDGKVNEVTDLLDPETEEEIDDSMKQTYYRDRDLDGYPDLSTSAQYCPDLEPAGWVTDENPNDCVDALASSDPAAANIYPGAPEVCNNRDDDCDTVTDEAGAQSSCSLGTGASTMSCQSGGVCAVATCNGTLLDCNGGNDCETPGTTLSNCRSCGNACFYSCGTTDCVEVNRVALGNFHSCATSELGNVACWGQNGQVVPTAVSGISNVSAIAGGGGHTCAIVGSSDAVYCWGMGTSGQLGNGGTSTSNSPVGSSGLDDVISISAGGVHTCAVEAGGAVRCWGDRADGRVGNTSNSGIQSTPTDVVDCLDDPVSDGAQVAAGRAHTCMISQTGSVRCWGDNASGQLGDGNAPTDRSCAVSVSLPAAATSISTRNDHTCVLLSTGAGYCWGSNFRRQIAATDTSFYDTPQLVAQLANANAVAVGSNLVCALASGTVRCWGGNSYGERGDSSTAWSHSPVTIGLSNVTRLSSGSTHVCAQTRASVLEPNGQLHCWGYNFAGQLGNNTTSGEAMNATPLSVSPLGG